MIWHGMAFPGVFHNIKLHFDVTGDVLQTTVYMDITPYFIPVVANTIK